MELPTASFPEPSALSDMLGKDFAAFLEPNFDGTRYEEEEKRSESGVVNGTVTLRPTNSTSGPSTSSTSTSAPTLEPLNVHKLPVTSAPSSSAAHLNTTPPMTDNNSTTTSECQILGMTSNFKN